MPLVTKLGNVLKIGDLAITPTTTQAEIDAATNRYMAQQGLGDSSVVHVGDGTARLIPGGNQGEAMGSWDGPPAATSTPDTPVGPASAPPPLRPVTTSRPTIAEMKAAKATRPRKPPWVRALFGGIATVGAIGVGVAAYNLIPGPGPGPGPGPTPGGCTTLSNFGCIPSGPYTMRLYVDGNVISSVTVELTPGTVGEFQGALSAGTTSAEAQCSASADGGCAQATYQPWNGTYFGFTVSNSSGTITYRVTRGG